MAIPRFWDKGETYRQIINSTRWRKLRNAYIVKNPLCERCLAEGKTTPASSVHHIDPLENYISEPRRMRLLAYDPCNLMSVCNTCHGTLHTELMSRRKDAHMARAKARTERFRERYLNRGEAPTD